MRISDWSSDVCSSDLNDRTTGTRRMAGNSFGTLFRFPTWGESHGPAIGVVVDGAQPHLALTAADIQGDHDRRRPGPSRYTTPRREHDTVRLLSGVYEELGREDDSTPFTNAKRE